MSLRLPVSAVYARLPIVIHVKRTNNNPVDLFVNVLSCVVKDTLFLLVVAGRAILLIQLVCLNEGNPLSILNSEFLISVICPIIGNLRERKPSPKLLVRR